MAKSALSDSHPFDTMLAVAEVIQNERLARLYARILDIDTPTVEELASRSARFTNRRHTQKSSL
ncbi:MAG: hypothetical protein ACI9TI_000273 [Natronomonas sp.]|jgi:hypothetical protein